jgi:MFS transporter, DHA3 family, macrolide efflux protein
MRNPGSGNWKKTISLFLLSQAVSLLGSSLVQYALMWYITLKTGSGIMMTIFIIAGFLPTFLISPFAGVWADRYDRKKLIILSDGGIAAATLILALVFTFITENVWIILTAAAVRAVGAAVQGPAVGAIIPQIVPQDKLMRVNGILGSIQSVIGLGSPVLSGILMSVAPLSIIFYIDVITAAAAIVLLSFFIKVKSERHSTDAIPGSHLKDLVEGFKYIKRHKYLVPFFGYIAFILFLVTPAAFLTPLQAARTYGPDVWRLTAIEVLFSLGMLTGSGLLALWGGFSNRMHTMLLSTFIMALCTIGLGLAPIFWIYLAVMGVFGIGLAFYNTPSTVILQEHVEEEFLGRIFSILTMLFTSLMPLSMLLFGPLAEAVSIEFILLITGGLMVMLVLVVPMNRTLMAAGLSRKAEEEPDNYDKV